MKFLTDLWKRFILWVSPPDYITVAEVVEVPPDPRHAWLPPDVKTNGELRPHLPSRTNRPMRYDQFERARKRRQKGVA